MTTYTTQLRYIFIFILLTLALLAAGQDTDRKIEFPDGDDFLTLVCDFHIHTVFSDGSVWPNIRVQEAVRDGLDAIALTEHIEYQPHKDDIPHPDRNRSFEIAKESAKAHDLIVIHGTEITRTMPPGHANALFVTDVNQIIAEDPWDAYVKAREQGAFIFWNHPNWMNQQSDAIPVVSDFHKKLIEADLLHGIEVVNDLTFSEEALHIAVEHNLTVVGTSDIHGLVDYQFEIAKGGHRPVMLVLAQERSEEAIKKALFEGRTVAWFENVLSGKEPHMSRLIDAALTINSRGYIGASDVLQVDIVNASDATLYLKNTSVYDFYTDSDLIHVLPHSTKKLKVLTKKGNVRSIPLTFDILNAVVDDKQYHTISIDMSEF